MSGRVLSLPLWRALVIAGLLIRLALIVGTTNSNDLAVFGTVAIDGANLRPLYEDAVFSYPPLVGYAFEAAGKVLALAGDPIIVHVPALAPFSIPGLTSADLTTPLATTLLKLPALVADALLSLAFYRVALRVASPPAARLLALVCWLNPLAIFTSSIQASWDSVVPLATLLTIVLALEGSWFLAGAALALGIGAKLVPVYLVFLAPALLTTAPFSARIIERRVALAAFGAAVAAAIALVPIAARNEWNAMFSAVFTRTGTFTIGGVNLTGLTSLTWFAPLTAWTSSHRGAYGFASLAFFAGASCATGYFVWRRADRDVGDYAAAVFALVAVLCLASPLTQPTYPLWLVPFGFFLAIVRGRIWWWITWAIVVLDLAFFAAVRAPQALLEPLCAFGHLCDPAAFGAASVAYATAVGFGGNGVQIAIDAVTGELAGIAMFCGLIAAFATLVRAPAPRSVPAPPRMARAATTRAAAAALAAVALVSWAPLVPAPPARGIAIAADGRNLVVGASGGYRGVAYGALREGYVPPIREVDAYFDPHYTELRGVTPTFAAGFASHLSIEFARRAMAIPIRTIDATGLDNLLHSDPDGKCLLVLGGALPENVRSYGRDALRPWIVRGGTVFWAGGPFDIVWSLRERSAAHAFGGPDYTPWHDLYGTDELFPAAVNVFYPPVVTGALPAPAWPSSQIAFDRTTYSLNSGPLAKRGGSALAYVDQHANSSVSSVPIGAGTLVFFGDAFNDELHAAAVIAQLLFTTAWYRPSGLRFVDGAVRDGGPPMTIANVRGGDRLAVFGDGPGHSPYAAYVMSPRLALVLHGATAVVESQRYAGDVRLTITRAAARLRRILVYVDPRHAGGESTVGFRESVANRLAASDRLAAEGITSATIDADGLARLLRSRDHDTALVIFDGVLPNTVRGAHRDLLGPWLRAGGAVLWAGGAFEAVYEAAGSSGNLAATSGAQARALWPQLYGPGKPFPPPDASRAALDESAAVPTAASLWWGGDFRAASIAVDAAALARSHGYAIGTIDRGASSLSLVRVGRGRLIFFAAGFDDASDAANDIAQLVFSGICDDVQLPPRAFGATLVADGTLRVGRLAAGERIAGFGSFAGFEPWLVAQRPPRGR